MYSFKKVHVHFFLFFYQNSSWTRIGKGDEVRLSYSISIFVSLLNCLALILVELPRIYSYWTTVSILLGVRLCKFFWIATPIIEAYQISIFSGLMTRILSKQSRRKIEGNSTNASGNILCVHIKLI